MFRGSLICMKTILKNRIYVLQTSTLCGEVAVGEDKAYDQTKLWHFRMAHISEQGLYLSKGSWELEKLHN